MPPRARTAAAKQAAATKSAAKKTAAKKTAAKTSATKKTQKTTKKTSKKTTKKTPAKKTPAKKTPAKKTTPPRRRALASVEPLRFAAGWRRIAGDVVAGQPSADPEDPTAIHVDLLRPRDLVALAVTFTGCELVVGGTRPPVVRPRQGATARLKVQLAFQHGFEAAVYEDTGDPVTIPDPVTGKPIQDPRAPDPANARTRPPVGFRPARGSRLVYDLAAGDEVEFSTAGILAAMSRLPLHLHELATSGDAPTVGTLGDRPLILVDPRVLHLGEGLVARLTPEGPVVEKATAAFLKTNPAPDLTTAAGALQLQRNLEVLRAEMASRTPALGARTTPGPGSVFRPGGGLVPDVIDIIRRNLPSLSHPPTADETAIEAPYRLVISPGPEARFAHAEDPVPAADEAQHVELWHSRLANLPTQAGKPPDENNVRRRIVRAVWARDRDTVGDAWKSKDHESDLNFPLSHADPRTPGSGVDPPFLGSLDRFDRHMLVRQTSETWIGADGKIPPVPVGADELWLSSLGAWLGLHGAWNTKPYSKEDAQHRTMQSLLAWDHVAPMGRDQYVRVVYPGYLYPFGHQTALVKVTERKMKDPTGSVAGLYQRMFLVIGERTRTYNNPRFPFERVDIRPLVTPPIRKPSETRDDDSQTKMFWPVVGGSRFTFVIHGIDRWHRPVRLPMPLIWVNEAFNTQANRDFVDNIYAHDPDRKVPAGGQSIAYVPDVGGGPDPTLVTQDLFFVGDAGFGESTPHLSAATVEVPAVQQLSATAPLPIRYFKEYVDHGIGSPTSGDVWAEVILSGTPAGELTPNDPTTDLPQMRFGAPPPTPPPPGVPDPSGSDRAGGFLAPDLPIRALSLGTGPVGDVASSVSNTIDPAAFLSGALPKLFGLIPLEELISAVAGDLQIPQVITETLGRVEQFITDAQRLVDTAEDALAQAQALVTRAQDKGSALQAKAQDAVTKATKLSTDAQAFAPKFLALAAALPSLDKPTIQPKIKPCFDALDLVVADARAVVALLPPQVATELSSIVDALATFSDAADVLETLLDLTDLKQRFRFEWRPELENWPAGTPIFTLRGGKKDHLVLAVEGTVAGPAPDVLVTAEIRDFDLTLFGTQPLMRVPFDHMFFKAGSSGKPEIDVVLGNLEFLGFLSFVETIKDLIPLDGFSDPPFTDVTPQGATAGFTLELPSLSIGVFTLANMSLGADVSIPFLGKTVTVGFNFCTRERPFTLTVMCLGGGGWFLIRVAPDGLDVLELGLEATACLAVDLGVASGSISASVGIYIRLEGKKGSLTGYFRLRGEVDVLGLISASIELYMELVYEFDTGKMIGRATITVEVDVLCFSASVQISAERQFAGSNGDPSFREVLGAGATSPAWTEYCRAFSAE